MIQGTLIRRTNKAEVYQLPDGSVAKRYVTDNGVLRAKLDEFSLLYLQEIFGEVRHNGWLYRTVKPLWIDVDRALVCMEFISGWVLSEVPPSRMHDAEYHCGIWLAFYHDKVLTDRTEGMIYTDFTVHNIILDFEQKTVIAIDPGFNWYRLGYVYEDVVRHIHSLIVILLKKRESFIFSIISFLKGYINTTKKRQSLLFYYKGLYRELQRQFLYYARKSSRKCLLFSVLIVALSPLYLLFVPGYLLLGSSPLNRAALRW